MVRPLNRKLFRDVWRLRSQVLTIALVVASGLGGFIGSLSTHASLVRLRDSYYDSGRFAHVFVTAKRAPRWTEQSLRALPGVADVETTVTGEVLVGLPGVIETLSGRVIALPERGAPRINRVYLKAGRWPDETDTAGALVSEAFATARRLSPGDRLTALINGKYETLEIRGVALSPEFIFVAGRSGFSDDTRYGIIWMNRDRLAAAYDMEGAFNTAALRLTRDASVPAVIDAVDRALAPFGSVGAHARADQLSHRVITQEINEQRVFGTVLPAVFLGVAIFLLNVLLARHIATERMQIAALKALGYDNAAVGLQYLKLATVIVLLGIVLGVIIGEVFGRWMTQLYARFFHFPHFQFWLDARVVAAGTLLAIVGGIGAAASAVWSVVRLPPAEAMRPPAPARFRPTIAERLGFKRWLSPGLKMILRELERRPWRTALTIIGAASSIAILIGGTWWGDAFDYLIESELQRRERSDVIVALTGSTAVAALHEARRLPGVLAAEGARDVPVRLRFGHRSYRTAVLGIEPGTKLREVRDGEARPITLVMDEIVLVDRLAGVLGVRPGEQVWVEPLEGGERARRLRVAALSGDLMGMPAYMTRRSAARLVGEDDTVTNLRLRLDPAQDAAFYRATRDIARFAAVGDKRLTILQFRETSARNLLFFTSFLSLFAACIAVGVVYNSARIVLAEHAWELATLRVLGFTRGEVSQILLGQVGSLTLVAVPIGCLAGYALAWLLAELIHGTEFRIPLVVLPPTYALAVLVMAGAAIISSLVVRRRIDRLDLVGVLKTQE